MGKYKGSIFGLAWTFFSPLLMLAVYTFVFSVVFKARWVGGTDSKTEFALVLFAGLMTFQFFSECTTRAPGLIFENPNFVKKIVFPLEILPIVCMCVALFTFCTNFLVWLAFYFVFFGIPPSTIFLLPLCAIPLILGTLGTSWILTALGVYLRDIAQAIGVFTSALMFLSPVFYPVSALPETYRPALQFNPLTSIIERIRGVMIWGVTPRWEELLVSIAISFLFAFFGYRVFQKARKGFADVL